MLNVKAARTIVDPILDEKIKLGRFEEHVCVYPFGECLSFASQYEVAASADDEVFKETLESVQPDDAVVLGSISVPKTEIVSVSELLESKEYTMIEMFCIYPHFEGWMFWRTRDFYYYDASLIELPDRVLESTVYDLADMRVRDLRGKQE
jgi:hypothetical protein